MIPSAYYAHSGSPDSKDKGDWHPLWKHLEDTGEKAAAFLERTGFCDYGRAAGVLHDLGKYSVEFQERLVGGKPVDHATAGAKEAMRLYRPLIGKIVAFCVAGHHSGLLDGVDNRGKPSLTSRLEKEIPDLDPIWKGEIALPALTTPTVRPRDGDTRGFCAAFFIRMLFSALVDADYLDTEAYYAELMVEPRTRGGHPPLSGLARRLDAYLDTMASSAATGAVNDLRQEVLAHARGKADRPPGLFSLTVPTGGGKTLTSLAFALDHAVRHGLDRVIYVIPYMSIVEQTAAVFRKALRGSDGDGADFVIEHHSSFEEEKFGKREARDKLRLAMENWDAPVVVTTAVQFFESLFANRPARCRKLHNISNGVVILDEAQTLPLKYLRPCVTALDELARNWRTSIVLCTATQPALRKADEFCGGFEKVEELAPDPTRLYQALKRTRISNRGEMDDVHLAACLRESSQVLCIVNTRLHARELCESLGGGDEDFHLTTLMCPIHRRERLKTVRERLNAGAPVRLVATSLVEAGVDIDFPVVWRAEAGLESIIQAAGRCNREGRKAMGDVFLFSPAEGPGRKPPQEVGQFADAARSIMRNHDDPTDLEAIKAYFKQVYWTKGEDALDDERILRSLDDRKRDFDFPFDSIAKKFRLIETPMVPIIVPYRGENGDDATVERLLDKLDRGARPGCIARRLQPYVVQIPPLVLDSLRSAGAVETIAEEKFERQFVKLSNQDLYRDKVGLSWEDPTFRKAEGLVC